MTNRPIVKEDFWALAKTAIENGNFMNGPVFLIDARMASFEKLNSERVEEILEFFQRLNDHGKNAFDLRLRTSILSFLFYHRISCALVMSDRHTYITGRKSFLNIVNKDIYGTVDKPNCIDECKKARLLETDYFTHIAFDSAIAYYMKYSPENTTMITGAEKCIPVMMEKVLDDLCNGKYENIQYPWLIGSRKENVFRKILGGTIIEIDIPEVLADNADRDVLWHYHFPNQSSVIPAIAV